MRVYGIIQYKIVTFEDLLPDLYTSLTEYTGSSCHVGLGEATRERGEGT